MVGWPRSPPPLTPLVGKRCCCLSNHRLGLDHASQPKRGACLSSGRDYEGAWWLGKSIEMGKRGTTTKLQRVSIDRARSPDRSKHRAQSTDLSSARLEGRLMSGLPTRLSWDPAADRMKSTERGRGDGRARARIVITDPSFLACLPCFSFVWGHRKRGRGRPTVSTPGSSFGCPSILIL